VCAEIEGAHTWDVKGRGHGSMVFTDMDKGWGNAKSCTSCGKCVQVCPTGALFEKNKPVAAKRKIFELSYRNEGEQMKKASLLYGLMAALAAICHFWILMKNCWK